MRKWIGFLWMLSAAIRAESLVDVCQAALKHDPTYQAARAEWAIQHHQYGLSRAAFFPTLNLTGLYGKVRMDSNTSTVHHSGHQQQWSMNLTQTLFDARAWNAWAQMTYQARQADAVLRASAQSILSRTAQHYFAVLMQHARLNILISEQRALFKHYQLAQQRFKAGLVTRITVLEAQSHYDIKRAQRFKAEAQLEDARHRLKAITGQTYTRLNGLGRSMPLVPPKPIEVQPWIDHALKYAPSIQALRLLQQSAKAGVLKAEAGHLPRVVLNGSITDLKQPVYSSANQTFANIDSRTALASVGVTLPLLEGGRVRADTQRAQALYHQSGFKQLEAIQQLSADVAQAVRGLSAGIQTIRANRQAVHSSQAALAANQAAYLAGTRTIVDVVNALSTYSQTQQQYQLSRYEYLGIVLSLKALIGELRGEDIQVISQWLSQPIRFKKIH